jgi:PadR family transcriptional regulator PadR
LRKEGLLEYEWQESPYGPPRKYYKLTHSGKEVLAALNESWNALADTVAKIKK